MGKAVGQQQFCDGHSCAAGAVYHNAAVLLLFAHHLQGVDDTRQHYDGRAVLVVVKNGDVQGGFQPLFNLKASGGGDVLQIDAPEAGSHPGHRLDDFLRVLGVQTDGDGIDAPKFFEQDGFSLHNRHGGMGPDVSQAQDGAAVGYHRYGVGFHGVCIGSRFVLGDDLAGFGHAGGVGQGQIFPGLDRRFGHGLQLAVPLLVKHKCFLIGCHIFTS